MNKTNILISILLFIGYTQPTNASKLQPISSIHEATRDFIATKLSLDTEYKLTLGQFDNRLKLPLCPTSLEVFTHSGLIKPGRNSIGVKCNSAKKWKIYTSALISIFKEVISLSQPVRRGEIFNANIIKFEKKDISTLRSGFITNPLLIINKQATRNLGLGAVINKSNVTEAKLIKRGEKVTITASSPHLNISMTGIAMMDGIKGQNIRIKNIKTKQIVQATVEQPGQVVVMF